MKNGATIIIGGLFTVAVIFAIYKGATKKNKGYTIDWRKTDEQIAKESGIDLDDVIKLRIKAQTA